MDLQLSLTLYEPNHAPPLDLDISLDPETAAELSECLRVCEQLPQVKDDATLAICIDAGKEIKFLIDGLERSRESLKKPFLTACRLIDASAKRARASLEEAYQDVMSSIAIFEGVRRKERDEEKARHEAELARLAREAHNETDEAKRAELIRQAQDAGVAANKIGAPVAGLVMRKTYKFEIEDPVEVLRFNKRLVRIEVNQSECLNLVRQMADAGAKEFKIPGIKITETTSAQVRGA